MSILLGHQKVVQPSKGTLRLFATPYFVTDPQVVTDPEQECVYRYDSHTLLYLDCRDVPYPGGCYFDDRDPSPYYRLCFLSHHDTSVVCQLAAEWSTRDYVVTIPTCFEQSRLKNLPTAVLPPFNESIRTGKIHKRGYYIKPSLLIQDILNSFKPSTSTGILLEVDSSKWSALSINGDVPDQLIVVRRPYDQYEEHVPLNMTWTRWSYVPSYWNVGSDMTKIRLDNTVIGFVHRDVFFCLSWPILEGRFNFRKISNTRGMFSVSKDLVPDVRVLEKFRIHNQFSLHHVEVKGTIRGWYVTQDDCRLHSPTTLPRLVKEWINIVQLSQQEDPWNLTNIRLAQTLVLHQIPFRVVQHATRCQTKVSEQDITLYVAEPFVQLLNNLRWQEICRRREENKTSLLPRPDSVW